MSEVWTVGRTLLWIRERFDREQLPAARLEAELLLADLLGLDRVGVFVHQDRPLSPDERDRLRERVRRRLTREPLAYILGRKAFLDVELAVGPGVLVPRPETEFVVDLAADLAGDGLPEGPWADLGTGSGAIAVGLSRRLGRPGIAVEREPAALPWARRNLEALAPAPWRLVRGDWAEPLATAAFALVAVNPPYVAESEAAGLAPELAHEPATALFAGDDGLGDLQRLAATLARVLRPGGVWIAEVGAGQRATVEAVLAAAGWRLRTWQRDFAGHDRVFAATAG